MTELRPWVWCLPFFGTQYIYMYIYMYMYVIKTSLSVWHLLASSACVFAVGFWHSSLAGSLSELQKQYCHHLSNSSLTAPRSCPHPARPQSASLSVWVTWLYCAFILGLGICTGSRLAKLEDPPPQHVPTGELASITPSVSETWLIEWHLSLILLAL